MKKPYCRYKDRTVPIEDRVSDLLSRMTLREKVRQMDMYVGSSFVKLRDGTSVVTDDAEILWDKVAEAIGSEGIGCIHDLYATAKINNEIQRYAIEKTRLGIPILFSEEGLHGLCRPGCTIFPQSIALASTWRPEIVEEVGRAIARETRSFNIHEIFGPVLDLARDPRWGRMEETFGEDTYLSSQMAVAMVRGLQGKRLSDPDSVVAEPKHFAGYGVPTGGLNCAPALIGKRELFMYHLPIFEAAIVEGGAINVMCSYNSIDGIPCSCDHELLTTVLRDQWQMRGFVRADLGALGNLYHWHRVAESREEAIRQSIEAGLDMQYYDYPHEFFQNALIKMVETGRMKEETIDRAVARILRVKFMLGLFDNPCIDPKLSRSVVRCEQHRQVALQAARDAICLLKNDHGLLPLPKDIGSVAVIGPNAAEARLGDYTPRVEGFEPVTVLDGIRSIVSPQTRVDYVKGTSIAPVDLRPLPSAWLQTPEGDKGLKAEYYDNPSGSGDPVLVRIDQEINFNWIVAKPCAEVGPSDFFVRWTGTMTPQYSFDGYLGIGTFDSMRVWVDQALLLDSRKPGAEGSPDSGVEGVRRVPFRFEAGRSYAIKIEYCKDAGGARVVFGWSSEQDQIDEAVKCAKNADVAIVVLGDSSETSGEGLDRVDLGLPGKQLDLLKAVYETGTPVVLVLLNGRALTLNWEAAHIPAIIEAWFCGEQGGTAIAETLFGDINPAGRLPVSFPKAVGQLPVYYNRQPGGRYTYVEMDWEPLFPFGYGLSYTRFSYANLRVVPQRIRLGDCVDVHVDITNTGDRDGEEVVQLYIRDLWSSVVRPHKELRRFRRVAISAGQTVTVSFTLDVRDFRLMDREYEWVVEPGTFEIMVGPHSGALDLKAHLEIY